MNPKDRIRTINDAKTGDIVTCDGTRWRVIGYTARPTALLEQVGCERMPVSTRTHHCVTLGSLEAREFFLSPIDQGEGGISNNDTLAADAQGEAGTEWGEAIDGPTMKSLQLPVGTPVGMDRRDGSVSGHTSSFFSFSSYRPVYRLRADHPYYRGEPFLRRDASLSPAPQQPDWTPDERTLEHVREVIASLKHDPNSAHFSEWYSGFNAALLSAVKKISPQPDRAEELINQYRQAIISREWEVDCRKSEANDFASWAMSRGEFK